MTKLEEKLIELGYKFDINNWGISKYQRGDRFIETICISKSQNMIVGEPCIYVKDNIKTQEDILDLQQAFNQLQKDLEVLKNVK